MSRRPRLRVSDLDSLTRAELISRIEAEQHYWLGKERDGFSDRDRAGYAVFEAIGRAAIGDDPMECLRNALDLFAGTGTYDYWEQVPGSASYVAPVAASDSSDSETSASR